MGLRDLDFSFHNAVRSYELQKVLEYFPGRSSVLEIGAGAGWQAKTIAAAGHEVVAIDVPGSDYSEQQIWPVQEYDGKSIPFTDSTFDLIFSSNVLEHVVAIDELLLEMKRVLKPSGIAIHVLPTSSWCVVTMLMHYFYLFKFVLVGLKSRFLGVRNNDAVNVLEAISSRRMSSSEIIRTAICAKRHGERGNVFSEVYWFSKYAWLRRFKKSGWIVEQTLPLGIIYSGYSVFGALLPFRVRRLFSFFIGSSCRCYILRSNAFKA